MSSIWSGISRRFSGASGDAEAPAEHVSFSNAANVHRESGNVHFRGGDYERALEEYNIGIGKFPMEAEGRPAVVIDVKNPEENVLALLYSNRSAAFVMLGRFTEAYRDAQICVSLEKKWPKGFIRMGKSLLGLGKHKEAAQAFLTAANLESAGRKKDAERHANELEAVQKQSTANIDAYLQALEDNKHLKQKLDDFSLVFGDTGKKNA
mmetsp:Transcript_7412/g.11895  ORF Transcript_7412/g.11895 Transcript_7412/m.11895 type:complete len:208 (-) Transcript_7412:556-1179(-)